ncbi:MAG TPA: serine/threonine-protein kinase, partial [bacterium]|nr:serine/threonine-protein kinase [bacterium]
MAAAGKRYELLDRIGVGGMAEVFRARVKGDTTGPIVVVKRILPHLSEDDDFRRMFMDEARIAAALQHPNIVRLVDLGRMEQSLFIALEYVDGMNLEQLLARLADAKRKVPLDVAVFIAVEILKGLQHAHTRLGPDGKPLAIVHRDVSPANVLLSREGAVKVSDFGLARAT